MRPYEVNLSNERFRERLQKDENRSSTVGNLRLIGMRSYSTEGDTSPSD